MLSVSPGMLTAKALLKEDPEGGKAAFALEAQSSWVLLALLARYCSRNGVADQYCSANIAQRLSFHTYKKLASLAVATLRLLL